MSPWTIVGIADGSVSASNVNTISERSNAPDAVIADEDVRRILTDIVLGLRAIRRRLESTPVD